MIKYFLCSAALLFVSTISFAQVSSTTTSLEQKLTSEGAQIVSHTGNVVAVIPGIDYAKIQHNIAIDSGKKDQSNIIFVTPNSDKRLLKELSEKNAVHANPAAATNCKAVTPESMRNSSSEQK
jgi:hypothetical protein